MTTQGADLLPARASTRRYLAEVHIPIQGGQDLLWIGRSLHAAGRRLSGPGRCPQVLSAVYSPADERLACILAAASWKDVRDLFEIALLPPARVLEVVEVKESSWT